MKTGTVIWWKFSDFTTAFYEAMIAEGSPERDIDQMPIPEYIDHIREWAAEDKAGE